MRLQTEPEQLLLQRDVFRQRRHLAAVDDPAIVHHQDGIADLNSLLDPGSGWELVEAHGINDAGQITGGGFYGGRFCAFVMTPVPEPHSMALAALGTSGTLILVGRGRRERRLN